MIDARYIWYMYMYIYIYTINKNTYVCIYIYLYIYIWAHVLYIYRFYIHLHGSANTKNQVAHWISGGQQRLNRAVGYTFGDSQLSEASIHVSGFPVFHLKQS